MRRSYGKYRGKVENNIDPLLQGRLQVSVPAVLGSGTLNWAMPCVPYAGPGVGLFLLPPIGANVWVEFEGGDPDYAIWAGCFWDPGGCPATPPLPGMKVLQTDSFSISINELAPGATMVSIGTQTGDSLAFGPTGITLSSTAGLVAISGTQITLNNDALVVLP